MKNEDKEWKYAKEDISISKKGNSELERMINYGIFRYFLLHPERMKDEIGSFLWCFVQDELVVKKLLSKRLSHSAFAEEIDKKREKERAFAQNHPEDVECWGSLIAWLRKLVECHDAYKSFD